MQFVQVFTVNTPNELCPTPGTGRVTEVLQGHLPARGKGDLSQEQVSLVPLAAGPVWDPKVLGRAAAAARPGLRVLLLLEALFSPWP